MGEAKQRGSREERTAKAIAQTKNLQPQVIYCDQCEKPLHNIEQLKIRNDPVLTTMFRAACNDCNQPSVVPIFKTLRSQQIWESFGPEKRMEVKFGQF